MTRTARTRPNERAIITSILLANTAVAITDALNHIAIEISRCDGMKSAGTTDTGRVSGGSTTFVVEAAVLALDGLTQTRDNIGDDLNEIERLTKRLARTTARALGQRAPIPITPCRNGGIGKTLSDDLNEKVEKCHEQPHAQGLCNTHYVAWRREQRAAGIDTSGMYEPAQ
jgi:hypothetical protein